MTKFVPSWLLQEGMSLHRRGAVAEAAARYEQVLGSNPDNPDALFLLGMARGQEGRFAESADLLRKAVRAAPKHAAAHNFLGVALRELEKPEAALKSFDHALRHQPDFTEACLNRASLLMQLGRRREALESYDRTLAVVPDFADGWCERGLVLEALGRRVDAIESFDRAIALDPAHAGAHANRGTSLAALDRHTEALESFERAIAAKPDFAEAFINRGNSLRALGRTDEGLESYERAVMLKPDVGVIGAVLTRRLADCDWDKVPALEQTAYRLVEAGTVVEPSVLVTCCADQHILFESAKLFARNDLPAARTVKWDHARLAGPKIKIAYLSADFHRHATAYLIAELLERHDRHRFEIIGVSWGPDDQSEIRARLAAAFDEFIDVSQSSNEDVAKMLCGRGLTIAVDLKGYTDDARPGIFAYRAAPIQVSYLGYPGTTGSDFIDYVIGDEFVTPFTDQPFYSEQIVQLPESYQANDSKRRIAERRPTRSEEGLPESGFVFCCFNNIYKLRRPMFDAWMRLLRRVDGSVLWLISASDSARRNLASEAQKRGIDPARLVFAAHVDVADHLARQSLADLFLDTLPYNAHTTASDALWGGLPVLTCVGTTFPGRVGASLLHAAGLPELVTHSLSDYEALALELASKPERLGLLRAKLADSRPTCPLFNADRLRRNLEAAYCFMWERWQRGEAADGFRVDKDGGVSMLERKSTQRAP